jgi:hypothetical protein
MRERLTSKQAAAEEKKKKPVKEEGSNRNLDGFDYNKSKAKILKNSLHNLNVALGTLIAAQKDLAILRGSDITPDGKIGGRGFIMEFREIKTFISDSILNLSNVTDSIADELTNPHWGLKEKEVELVEKEQEVVDEKVEQVEDVKPGEAKVEEKTIGGGTQDITDKAVAEDIAPIDSLDTGISPEDVRCASYLNRYRDMLGSNAADKVASVLGKKVLATISLQNRQV